jgi:hypothetical protein
MSTQKLSLIAYKTDKGLYYANSKWDYRNERECIYNSLLVNEKLPVKSEHKSSWYFLEGEDVISSIKQKESGGYGEASWVLRDESTHIEGVIPKTLSLEDADELNDSDNDFYIGSRSKYYAYRGLYHRVKERLPEITVDVEFEVDYKGIIEHTLVENNFKDMKVRVSNGSSWTAKVVERDLTSITHYYELEELLTPDLVLHNRPCYIGQDNTYSIVRNYIKEHINPKYARITSDYDFCFTVKKLIHIKPLVNKTEIKKSNGRSYAKPQFKTQTVSTKEVEIFEMCPSKKYNSYTPIEGFKGDSLADLVENMKLYLDYLMEVINSPVHECTQCNGLGCTYDKVENINERMD